MNIGEKGGDRPKVEILIPRDIQDLTEHLEGYDVEAWVQYQKDALIDNKSLLLELASADEKERVKKRADVRELLEENRQDLRSDRPLGKPETTIALLFLSNDAIQKAVEALRGMEQGEPKRPIYSEEEKLSLQEALSLLEGIQQFDRFFSHKQRRVALNLANIFKLSEAIKAYWKENNMDSDHARENEVMSAYIRDGKIPGDGSGKELSKSDRQHAHSLATGHLSKEQMATLALYSE